MSIPSESRMTPVGVSPFVRQEAERAKRLIPVRANITGTGTGSAQTIGTAREGEVWRVVDATVTNTTGTAATLTIHIVPEGGTIGSTNMYLDSYNVPANTTLSFKGLFSPVLQPGDMVQVYSGTSGALNVSAGIEA